MTEARPDPTLRYRRPPTWLAIVVCALAVTLMALLRLGLFPRQILPIAYGIPVVLFVWVGRRGLLWLAVLAFTLISTVKYFWLLPRSGDPAHTAAALAFNFLLTQVDLLVIAAAVHALIAARERIEGHNRELRTGSLQLEAINRELAAREEEVARQNDELQGQAEELERQAEELRVGNGELARREHVTQTLLSLSRSLTTELSREEMMARICEVVGQLLNDPTTAAAVVEQEGDRLAVRCHQGFGPAGPRELTLPLERSFAALVLSRGRTAYVEDLSLRPDLVVPQPKDGRSFAAVLAAPLRAMGWPVGTLEVYRTTPGPWRDGEVAVVESLAAQTSISLEALRQLHQVSQERRRFETVLRTAPVGIAVCNADCTDVRLNPAAAAMFGVSADANYLREPTFATATTYHEGRLVPPEQWPLSRAAREGQDVHGIELEVLLPTGRRLSLLTNATPVRGAAGDLAGAVAAFVDITAQKELQRELDLRRREAEEASVRKTRFLAAVSHDIRTPANAITLLAELIRRTASNPALAAEVPELAQELHASALSLVELLGDVLDLARYDSGRIELQESEFSLGELIAEEHRRFAPLARERGLALDLSPPDPPVRLRTDRIKLSRVIGNLLGNAMKFTGEGGVRVEAARAADGSPVVRVSDTGIGIPPHLQQQIFDEFVQLHNRERDRNKGTCLGLTIRKRLGDAMGGALSLESEPTRGSTFTVTLPARCVVG